MDSKYIEIGKIVNTHGLRGDVKVIVWMDSPEDFESVQHAYIGSGTDKRKLTVEKVRYQKNNCLLYTSRCV